MSWAQGRWSRGFPELKVLHFLGLCPNADPVSLYCITWTKGWERQFLGGKTCHQQKLKWKNIFQINFIVVSRMKGGGGQDTKSLCSSVSHRNFRTELCPYTGKKGMAFPFCHIHPFVYLGSWASPVFSEFCWPCFLFGLRISRTNWRQTCSHVWLCISHSVLVMLSFILVIFTKFGLKFLLAAFHLLFCFSTIAV